MFEPDQYELIDFGEGRKLERFGGWVLDRPSPAASGVPEKRTLWRQADARYDRTGGETGIWSPQGRLPEAWLIRHPSFQVELKPTDFGHLGVFPEQAANWGWLAGQIRGTPPPCGVLNLFAYTGASTLACAAAGAAVTHVDAARNVVAWGRRNAELSDLADAPVRWICEDARRYVDRELRRRRLYQGIALDPPSYGHGPQGRPWKYDEHFEPLLDACVRLLAPDRAFLLVTCHTPGETPQTLAGRVRRAVGSRGDLRSGKMELTTADGRTLDAGVFVRWTTLS